MIKPVFRLLHFLSNIFFKTIKMNLELVQADKTTNYILITSTANPITIRQTEYISRLRKFRVAYISLNLAAGSSALAALATAPNITVRSRTFSSITNNSLSFANGLRLTIIASFPNHFGDYAANLALGRVTAKLEGAERSYIVVGTEININTYDMALQFEDGTFLVLDPGDFWTVCLETQNYQ
jgi:hypothetical protein